MYRYSSNPQIGGSGTLNEDEENVGENYLHNSHRKSVEDINLFNMSSNHQSSSRSTPRSLNPELLMREFTQDEQGRMDSLGATDSPSGCFQSQFAREVVQNTRRSSSVLQALDSTLTSTENSLANQSSSNTTMTHFSSSHVGPASNPNSATSSNGAGSAARNARRSLTAAVRYRSQFAAKHHQVGQC